MKAFISEWEKKPFFPCKESFMAILGSMCTNECIISLSMHFVNSFVYSFVVAGFNDV